MEELKVHPEFHIDRLQSGATAQEIILRLVIRTSDEFADSEPATGTNLVVALDRSSSMRNPFSKGSDESKRDGMAQAARRLVEKLNPEDHVTPVAFAAGAEQLGYEISGDNKRELIGMINQLRANGMSTNFEAALAQVEAAVEGLQEPGTQRVILLTDGLNNTGDFRRAVESSETLADKGVTVDCLGIGEDFDMEQMKQLTGPSTGNTRRLMDGDRTGEAFADLLEDSQNTVLESLLLRLRIPTEGHSDLEFYQSSPETRLIDVPKPRGSEYLLEQRIGGLRRYGSQEFLLKFNATDPNLAASDGRAASFPVCDLRVDYRVSESGESRTLEESIQIPISEQPGREDPNVSRTYNLASLYKLEREFRTNIDTSSGDPEPRNLKKAIQTLLEMERIADRYNQPQRKARFRKRREQLENGDGMTQDMLNEILAQASRSTRAQRSKKSQHRKMRQKKRAPSFG